MPVRETPHHPSTLTDTPPHHHHPSSRFARALRLRLWGEHVGLLDDKVRASVLARLAAEGRGAGPEEAEWDAMLDGVTTPEEVAFAPILDPVAPEVSERKGVVMQ